MSQPATCKPTITAPMPPTPPHSRRDSALPIRASRVLTLAIGQPPSSQSAWSGASLTVIATRLQLPMGRKYRYVLHIPSPNVNGRRTPSDVATSQPAPDRSRYTEPGSAPRNQPPTEPEPAAPAPPPEPAATA